jgi:hypothetical protein
MSIDRANGIWFRNVPWEPTPGIAVTDIPTNCLRSRDMRWAVYHLNVSDKYLVVPFDDLRRALRAAPVRDAGRKTGPYQINAEEETINGIKVSMFSILPSSATDVAYQIRSRAIEAYQAELDNTYDPDMPGDAREYVLRGIAARRGQRLFRASLIHAYGGQCAITGCGTVDVLEAAHITPYAGRRSDDVRNGILLRADIHTLFDLFYVTVGDDYTVRVSPRVQDEYYQHFNNTRLNLPSRSESWPSRKALEIHRKSFQGG